ncbi:MAG: RsmE family RNA methyltransferase [Kiritimatiellia bacterium]
MNRILFEPSEIEDGIATFGGMRAVHVRDVLHGEVGQIIRTGVVDGPIGTSEIVSIRSTAGAAAGCDTVIKARVTHAQESLAPWVDVILAPPRPRVMKRLLPQLATLGVGTIVLVGAQKVEKDFWGATLLKPENYRPLLLEGLMQGGTSIVPRIELRRGFRAFLRDELDVMFPGTNRVVAHPYGRTAGDDLAPRSRHDPRARLLLAIGPEGGWTDEEVARLEAQGFRRYSLGRRILRTDTATIALLAKLNTEDK